MKRLGRIGGFHDASWVPVGTGRVITSAPDGRIGGIEVKSSTTVSPADFRHLARLRDLLDVSGGRFVRGVVLYTGDQVLPFGDRLVAMPLAALWMPRE